MEQAKKRDCKIYITDITIEKVNQGEVYVINKTSAYNFENTRRLLIDIYKSLPDGSDKSKRFVKEFLKRCKEGGIEYGK